MVNLLQDKKEFLVLDIETTNLPSNVPIEQVGITQIALVNQDKKIVFSSKCKPKESSCVWSEYSKKLSKIGSFEGYPSENMVISIVEKIMQDKTILVYNEEFDIKVLEARGADLRLKEVIDVMPLYAKYVGEWSYKYNDWKRQKLPHLSPLQAHDAAGDCLSTIGVLERMEGINTEYFDLKI